MATTTLTTGQIGAYEITLTASTVDTVNFAGKADAVEVTNHDASSIIYVRLDGTDPAATNASTIQVPPNVVRTITVRTFDADQPNTQVRLISSGTPKYSVSKGTL